MFYLYYLYLFTHTDVQHGFNIRCFIYVICFYLHILMSNTVSISDVLFMLFVFIYTYWCPTRFQFQMFYLCYLYLFTHTGVQHGFNIRCFIYVICIYLHILVSNTVSISDDVRVV
jgi:hypothetical protein